MSPGAAAPDVSAPTAVDATPARVLSDGQVAGLAVAATAGAWWAEPPPVPAPLLLALIGTGLALRWRRPWPLALALALLTATLSGRAYAGLDPAPAGPVQGAVVLVKDPETLVAGTTAIARLDGRRVELWAHGSAAAALRRAWAGDVVELSGSLRPLSVEEIHRAPWRRVVGELNVDGVRAVRPGSVVSRVANELHRRLDHGARSIPPEDRALLAGLVLGDDRDQPAVLRDAFDSVGLSHLLAVSGQNVAFVLTAAAPLIGRLKLVGRWVAVVALLAFFAVLTRFEPSVLRAVTMAGLAATATALGRPASGLRVLGLAVTLLVVVDPLLVRSLGFQLSVLASGGILVLGPGLARRLPLPTPVATALAVPLAAQLATAPLLAGRNGGLGGTSILANVLADPAAGAVMTWGSSVGIAAGYLPDPLATAAAFPLRVLLVWIRTVALRCARLPPFTVPARLVAAGLLVVAVMVLLRRRGEHGDAPLADGDPSASGRSSPSRPALAGLLAGLALALGLFNGSTPIVALPDGAALHRAGAAEVLVIGRPLDGARLLRALRGRIEGPLDLLVVTSPSSGAWRSAAVVGDRYPLGLVVAPTPRPDATVAVAGARFVVGPMTVELVARARSGAAGALDAVVAGADPPVTAPGPAGRGPAGRDTAGRDTAGPSP